MTIYAIGDVQGCYNALQALLDQLHFQPDHDVLWFTGDLVNRGSASLEVLRFIRALGSKHKIVLGNHDLHLLAVARGQATLQAEDTFHDVLLAPDKEELIDWLIHCPLLVHDEEMNCVMTHAGLAPTWPLKLAQQLAQEVETVLQGKNNLHFLKNLYGNEPNHWDDHLTGINRLRCITNYFTRMRFCDEAGNIYLAHKGPPHPSPTGLIPWFEVKSRANTDVDIIFGHWAALNGITTVPHIFALDTGCVWGRCLTAIRLPDKQRFSVKCN